MGQSREQGNRRALFWYYSLRGISLIVVPFSEFDFISLSIFSIFHGLDWVATGPATFALTNEVFGRRDTPVILSWTFAGHQVGGALAAFGYSSCWRHGCSILPPA